MKKLLAVTALFAAFSFTSLEADASSKLKKKLLGRGNSSL